MEKKQQQQQKKHWLRIYVYYFFHFEHAAFVSVFNIYENDESNTLLLLLFVVLFLFCQAHLCGAFYSYSMHPAIYNKFAH